MPGVRPKGASIPYAATKAALNHVTRLRALSLAPDIRVNAVAPGLVDTPLTPEPMNSTNKTISNGVVTSYFFSSSSA